MIELSFGDTSDGGFFDSNSGTVLVSTLRDKRKLIDKKACKAKPTPQEIRKTNRRIAWYRKQNTINELRGIQADTTIFVSVPDNFIRVRHVKFNKLSVKRTNNTID